MGFQRHLAREKTLMACNQFVACPLHIFILVYIRALRPRIWVPTLRDRWLSESLLRMGERCGLNFRIQMFYKKHLQTWTQVAINTLVWAG